MILRDISNYFIHKTHRMILLMSKKKRSSRYTSFDWLEGDLKLIYCKIGNFGIIIYNE